MAGKSPTAAVDPGADIEAEMLDQLVASFFVYGEPAPGGSKTFIPIRYKNGKLVIKTTPSGKEMPVGKMVDAAKGNARWKRSVAFYARKVCPTTPFDCPLGMYIVFYRLRPKYHFGTGRNAGILKASAPDWPAVMPDTTKLLRSTEDALKGIIWTDDSRIVDQAASKRYGDTAGAKIVIWRVRREAVTLADLDNGKG